MSTFRYEQQPIERPHADAELNGADGQIVPLRVPNGLNGIEIVALTVSPAAEGTDSVMRDGRAIGYIHRAGSVFVALVGERLDLAVECGQSLLWDKAAGELLRACTERSARATILSAMSAAEPAPERTPATPASAAAVTPDAAAGSRHNALIAGRR